MNTDLTTDVNRSSASWRLTGSIVALGLAGFLGFVYGYPKIFAALDGARPDKYLTRVEAALAEGDVDRAVTVAREASRWRPLDPMAHTMLGRAFMAAGNAGAAEAAFEEAVRVPTTPAPAYRRTHRPYFFAPARLSLARLAVARESFTEALAQLALAGVYADLDAPEFGAFRSDIEAVEGAFGVDVGDLGANWIGIDAMRDGSAVTPGWIDVARDWYGLREEAAGRIEKYGERTALVVTNDDIDKMALFYSVPLAAGADTDFVLEGDVWAPETQAVLGWQALDADERAIDEGWLFDQERTAAWASRRLRIPANYFYAEVRAVLGVTRHEGSARFSNVRLVPEP